MIRDSDMIFFCLSRWDSPYSSTPFMLAKEFAKKNRVFYIDHPFSVKDFISEYKSPKIKSRMNALLWGKNRYKNPEGFSKNITFVTPKLTIPVNFLSEGPIYNRLSKINDEIIFGTIRKVIHDFKIKQFIFFNAFDPYFCRDFPSDIKPIKKIYQSLDDLSQVGYTAKHGVKLEADIVKKFDITLTTSRELQRLKSQYSEQVYYLPNAADFSVFQTALTEKFPRPTELLPAQGKKIIGYTGNIEGRIDYQLLQKVIESNPDKIIAMVGPVTTADHRAIGLTDYPNVVMVGPKKLHELPKYLQYFDCALIPFKKNTLTKSIYPLKINEYLSAGSPVVATDFSEDIKSFRDVAYIATNDIDFVQSIGRAINENNADRVAARIKVANQNTWDARVETFWNIMEGKVLTNA